MDNSLTIQNTFANIDYSAGVFVDLSSEIVGFIKEGIYYPAES